jgi:hypothetical protein
MQKNERMMKNREWVHKKGKKERKY